MKESNQEQPVTKENLSSDKLFVDGVPVSLFIKNMFYQLISVEHGMASARAKAKVERYTVCENCKKDSHYHEAKYCTKCGFALNDHKESL